MLPTGADSRAPQLNAICHGHVWRAWIVLLSADGVAADAIMATTDLPLAFHPSATGARLMFTPIGAGLAIARRAEPLFSGSGDCDGRGSRAIDRRLTIQSRMPALGVLAGGPSRDDDASMSLVVQYSLVERLVPHPAVKAFDKPILHRLAPSRGLQANRCRAAGAMQCHSMRFSEHRRRIAFEVSSVTLSLTITPRFPRCSIRAVSSRATRRPEMEVAGIVAKHSRVTSSITLSTRKRWQLANWSWTKSSDHRALARASTKIGARVPTALRRAFHLRTVNPSSRYSRQIRLMPEGSPSRRSRTNSRRQPNPPTCVGKLPQPTAQLRIGSAPRLVAAHLATCPDNPARPPLRKPEQGLQMRDRPALHGRRQHFFATGSFIAARSSICSASSFFSRPFSYLSVFSRLAFDTVTPPNLAYQL